ncbi:Exosome complex exonuclease RRP44 A [Phytophthora fragariae]|uniref:Exosome complex exonuclease RRP44 A n=1 Tax=Phytophthora fragariae TaxID=53985 RepID=A0A6A3FIM7_9STRA|nr:Exosome complex exonuclease RRP44 A [Phytophthora fragariae]KAE8945884.1 Exosome complex exonuclease RRP44 A [Phytophthora fragariae]KAE9000189.1 Exosome complex exonuclease RRP44 A [Phytophthora fragariae]KAE9098922.1 Exosome complex exonuclease RRP44 A [Phytophthora fragariae]KAE9134633.1 Exosome complex exonuclease RRP44 A [Phytophthora fragariae]
MPMAKTETEPLLWCVDELNVATRRGRIVRKVKERYLRDDLSCSLPACALCSADDDASAATHVLGTTKTLLGESPRDGVYLLPSMRTVLLQMDALELSTKKQKTKRTQADAVEVFADVLVLETVWEYVKRQDLGVYNRLRAVLMNADRRFVVFANEHHRSTFVQKKQLLPLGFQEDPSLEDTLSTRETETDRNERAVAAAWTWYADHLKQLQRSDVRVLFLANDAEDLQHAEQYGVTGGVTIADFLKPVAAQHPELLDLLSASAAEEKQLTAEGVSSTAGRGGKKKLYPEHLSAAELLAGIKNKRFFKGTIRCNRDHWLECHVLIHGANGVKIPVLLQGREHINRAIDGDLVAIQLLPKEHWKKPSDSFAANGTAAAEAAEEADDDKDVQPEPVGVAEPTVSLEQVALVQSDASQNAKPAGRVVGIIQRNWRKFCGSLEPPRDGATLNGSGSCLVVPVDRKVPKIKIQTRQQEALMDKRLLVAIDSWPADSKFPLGHYVRTLGVIGDKETETNVLLIEHDIPCDQFSDEVMRCLPPEDWKITAENSTGRRNLRDLPVMSIDPPNCKDIDDALHAKLLPNGNLQVGVHIADVTHFVAPGSPLDEEAADRGTSTYLVDRRLDMLPGLLTTKLCSLTDVEDHFAFSVLWELKLVGDNEVQVIDVSFCKSLIRSVASLSYQQAQEFLDDPSAGGVYGQDTKPKKKKKGESEKEFERRQLLGSGIKTLNVIARRLRAKRIEAGALTLASPEVRFVLDTETQNPLDVQMYTLRDTNALVEEFMLLANITVAKKIVRHFPTFSMLRRHPAPSKRQFDLLCSQAKAVGVELHVDTSKQLQDSLDAADILAREESTGSNKGKRKQGSKSNPYFNKLLRIMTTRCMMPASYFSSGEVAPPEFHHYGLAAPIYTHFTSPIRRYADVVVHRLLAAAIGVAPLPSYLENKSHLHEISDQLNRRHHAAQLAGRASVTLHTVLYFQQYPTRTDAVITKVKNNGVAVLLPRFGIEGMIFLCEKDEQEDEDVVRYDANSHSLILVQKNNRTLQVFDRVRVKVYVALTFGNRQELKMDLLDEDDDEDDNKEDAAQKEAEANLRAARKKRKVAP